MHLNCQNKCKAIVGLCQVPCLTKLPESVRDSLRENCPLFLGFLLGKQTKQSKTTSQLYTFILFFLEWALPWKNNSLHLCSGRVLFPRVGSGNGSERRGKWVGKMRDASYTARTAEPLRLSVTRIQCSRTDSTWCGSLYKRRTLTKLMLSWKWKLTSALLNIS